MPKKAQPFLTLSCRDDHQKHLTKETVILKTNANNYWKRAEISDPKEILQGFTRIPGMILVNRQEGTGKKE